MKFKKQGKYIYFIFVILSLISSFLGLKINEKYDSQSKKEDKNNQLYQSSRLTVTDNYSKEIVLNKDGISLILKYSDFKRSIKKNKYILTIFGNSLTNFDITSYDDETDEQIFLPIKKYLYNGYILIIDSDMFSYEDDIRLELNLHEQFMKELIYIGTRRINNNRMQIEENDHHDVILNENIEEDCFKLDHLSNKNRYSLEFLTYTKNIWASLYYDYNYKEKKIININDESMTFIIEPYFNYDEICFTLDKNEKEGSLSFELIDLDSLASIYEDEPGNIMIYNNFTLIRGLATRHYLPRGHGFAHRTKDYLFKDRFSLHNVKLRKIKGNSKLIINKCINYPYCYFYKEDLDEAEYSYENINGYISVKKYLEHDFKNYIAVVYCPEEENLYEDCEYEIEMKNEDEASYLYEKQVSYSFVNLYGDEFQKENFKINVGKEFTQNDELYIYFNLFSGNAKIQFFNLKDVIIEDYKINNLGNVNVYIFQKNVIDENPEIYIKVIRDQNAYFSISYEIKNMQIQNQYFIEEGILNYVKVLTNSENIHITNYYKKNNYYPFIINVNTFGNNFEINNFEDSAIINKYPDFNLIQIIFEEMIVEGGEEKQYSLGIKKSQGENEEKQFLYNIIGFKANAKILINNGQNYINHLSMFNKEAIYVYTFSKRDNDDNKLVINFRKFSKHCVKISVNIGESGNTDYFINRLSRIIIFNNSEINQTCNYLNSEEGEDECKILVKVTSENKDKNAITEDPSTHIDFSIQIYGNDEPLNPIFLPQNTFISNLLLPNFTITYLVDVPQYGEGKIYVDFMEGGGMASAKLINRKTKSEENIKFDYYNKYFDILSDKTKFCEEEDCEILIELITKENIYKYNIYSKLVRNEDKEAIPFLAPEYEYIYGNLKGNQIDHYKTKISKDTDNLIFNIFCDNCYINIIYDGKTYQVDSSLEKEIIIRNEHSDYNFYGKTIYYNIEIKEKDLTAELNYNLRIISPGINLPVIIPMTSLRNEHCKINEASPCYFIIPMEKYNKVDKIRIFVPDNDNVCISHKTLNYISFYEKKDEEIYNSLQSGFKTNYGDMFQNNYFELKIGTNSENFEKIYIIKIELNYSANITVISSHYNIMDYQNINPILNDYNLISLDGKEKMSFSLSNKGFYSIGINLIRGIGKINYINFDNSKSYLLDYKVQENINLLLDSEENNDYNKKIIEILKDEDEEEDEFIIYFRILFKENNINLAELNFQKSNYFDYLYNNRYISIWPLNFYMKINITSDDFNDNLNLKNINLNYKFSKLDIDTTSKNIIDLDKEKFDIKVYLVDASYINKRKLTQNNIDYLSNNINSKSNYRIDLTSGFSLVETKNIKKEFNLDQENFLYIVISPPEKFNNNNIRLVFSVFDLTNDYILPRNEYLTLSINQETKINLGRNLEDYKNSEIEFVLNNNDFNFAIISQNSEDYYINDTSINAKDDEIYYGKTIINKKFLENEKTNILFLFNKGDYIENIITNVFIKYRISCNKVSKFFEIEDGNVKIEDLYNSKYIIFKGIKEILDTKIDEETIYIYNIRIYNYTNNNNEFSNNIFNNETPIKIIKIKNSNSEIHEQINEIGVGQFYISVLAEARKGNIYEYFTYNLTKFLNISECNIVDIDINEDENFTFGKYAKSYIYRAKIHGNNGDFIKLNIKHNNILEENNYIYVSSDKSFENVKYKELYKNSEYKNIERDSALIIPVDENKLDLIIRIPCNDICDYTFYYKVYKNDESIKINSDECFDFNINNKYNFIYSNEDINNKTSLLTMTGYSMDNFIVSNEDNKLILDKTYFNGYSSIISDNIAEFSINNDEKNLMVKICHRTLSDNNDEQYNIKNIFVEDKIYTRIEENKEECFKINGTIKNDIVPYLLTFITKSNNINVKFKNTNDNTLEEEFNIDGESEDIIFNSTYNLFCIKKNNMNLDDYNEDIGIFINLLSINEKGILNMSLIKGVSTKQILPKGKYIYYRINEYSQNSSSINIHFQNISGETEVFITNCKNYPYCSFSNNKNLTKYCINNNIYYKVNIESEENIYHKSELPMIKIHCIGGEEEDYCTFYIEMANNDDNILLNKNKKIFSSIQTEEERHKYKFSLRKSDIKKDLKKQLFIQLYSLTGNNNLIVNGGETAPTFEKYYKYNNNTIFYLYDFNNNNKDEFSIEVEGEKNSYYNLIYYTINEEKEKENENNIYLTTGEIHYSIITKKKVIYNYYFQERSLSNNKDQYLVNIDGINCILNVQQETKNKFEKSRHYQFILNNKNEKIFISSEMDDICEFTISAIVKSSSQNNNLIINNRVSQTYKFDGQINAFSFNYLILKEDLINKNIFININKNTQRYLIMDCAINKEFIFDNKTLHNNIEIFELKEIINYDNLNSFLDKNNIETENNLISIELNLYVKKVEHFDFKIKISPINLPSFLNQEEIEYGYIKKNEYLFYFLEYKKDEDLQIYFDVKGNATFKVNSNINKYNQGNVLQYNDIYIKDFNFNKPKTNTNYINIDKCKYEFCHAYIKVFISDDYNNNNASFFSLYAHSDNTKLNVPKNRNIHGVLSSKNKPHLFYTLINPQKNDNIIKIVLNCKKCFMCYYTVEPKDLKEKCKNPLDPSKEKYFLIKSEDQKIFEKIYYKIYISEGEYEQNIYSIYILDSNSPKFITQSVPEICKTTCKFLLPLYEYYIYNDQNIILFIPDDEQTIIYVRVEKMHDDEAFKFDDMNINNNFTSINQSLISNKMILNLEQIKEKFNENDNLYIKIQIESKINDIKNITFIINKFYNSLDTEINPPLQNIFIINDSFVKNDLLNNLIRDNEIYKININLIGGSGQFSLSNNNQNIKYSLGYDTQDSISLILKNNDLNLNTEKNIEEDKFIFYMDIVRKQEKDELIFRKTNYFKYFGEDGKSDIFPINLKLNLENIKEDLHINLRFSNLVELNPDYNNENLFNITNEKFNFIVSIFDNENKNSNNNIYYKYYNDLRRGYIFIEKSLIKDKKYLEIKIDKDEANENNYKSVSLDITPFDINEDIELPRNSYLEMKINKYEKFKLSKPLAEYNNLYLELSTISNNNYDLNFNNINDIKKETNYGKNLYSINNNSDKDYKININLDDTVQNILLKYIVKKENITNMNINKTDIIVSQIDNETYKISYDNILPENANINDNYKINYFVRLYKAFDFDKNEEPKNIYVEQEPILFFKKELNNSDLNNETISYNVNLGKLERNKYFISVLGEVVNDTNVEYFAYNYYVFSIKNIIVEPKFDFTWIIIIIILLSILIVGVYYIIKQCIQLKNKTSGKYYNINNRETPFGSIN